MKNYEKKALEAKWLMFISFLLFTPSLLYAAFIDENLRVGFLDTVTAIFIIFGFGGLISGIIMNLVYTGRYIKHKQNKN
tara:strand:+ start:149 stop:385 length:237 start_codon:yes stop_codon:yes gene_type:complete